MAVPPSPNKTATISGPTITARFAGEIQLHFGNRMERRSNTVMYIYAPNFSGWPDGIPLVPLLSSA